MIKSKEKVECMASTKSYCDFVLEQLSDLDDITYRPMMGEFLLYYRGRLFGGIYDDRLLVKQTVGNGKFNLPAVVPYPHAKPMCYISDIEDRVRLYEIVSATVGN